MDKLFDDLKKIYDESDEYEKKRLFALLKLIQGIHENNLTSEFHKSITPWVMEKILDSKLNFNPL